MFNYLPPAPRKKYALPPSDNCGCGGDCCDKQDAAKLGGWLDSLLNGIGQGIQVAGSGLQLWGSVQQQFGGGVPTGGAPARGLQAITRRTGEILAALQALKSQVGQRPYQEIEAAGKQLVGLLSNPNVIYQAERGEDAAVLRGAKTQANTLLQEILASAGSITGNVQNQTGQIINSGGNVISTGFDTVANNPWLYVAGGAAVAYFLVKRK